MCTQICKINRTTVYDRELIVLKTFIISKKDLRHILSEHIHLPHTKLTQFKKTSCRSKYYLKWSAENENDSEACLSFDGEHPVLTVDVHDKQNDIIKNIIRVVWNDWSEFSDFSSQL